MSLPVIHLISVRHPSDPKIAITDIGLVSLFDVGHDRFWECTCHGQSGTHVIVLIVMLAENARSNQTVTCAD